MRLAERSSSFAERPPTSRRAPPAWLSFSAAGVVRRTVVALGRPSPSVAPGPREHSPGGRRKPSRQRPSRAEPGGPRRGDPRASAGTGNVLGGGARSSSSVRRAERASSSSTGTGLPASGHTLRSNCEATPCMQVTCKRSSSWRRVRCVGSSGVRTRCEWKATRLTAACAAAPSPPKVSIASGKKAMCLSAHRSEAYDLFRFSASMRAQFGSGELRARAPAWRTWVTIQSCAQDLPLSQSSTRVSAER